MQSPYAVQQAVLHKLVVFVVLLDELVLLVADKVGAAIGLREKKRVARFE